MLNNTLVSVCVITYNQVLYISQTLNGILSQKTNFPIEILIGDDCSTDGTSDIVDQYFNLYPNRIRVIRNEINKGMSYNLFHSLSNCKGDWIAICEGDDFWTDANKLQKQIDFLHFHPECNICFHKVMITDETGINKIRTTNDKQAIISTIEDLAYGNYIPTVSVVFKNHRTDYPDWIYSMPAIDYPLHLCNASTGKIGFIPEVMAVYRTHDKGVWSSVGEEKQLISLTENILLKLIPEFQGKTKDILILQLFKTMSQLFEIYIETDRLNNISEFIERNKAHIKLDYFIKFIFNQIKEEHTLAEKYKQSKSFRLGNMLIKPSSFFLKK